MHCAIWYHLYNLKNLKNNHGGVLFFTFFNCANGTKSCKTSHIVYYIASNVHYPVNLGKKLTENHAHKSVTKKNFKSWWQTRLWKNKWVKIFTNRQSKICGRKPLKNLKWYGLFKQIILLQILKGCLAYILLSPFLNTLSQITTW